MRAATSWSGVSFDQGSLFGGPASAMIPGTQGPLQVHFNCCLTPSLFTSRDILGFGGGFGFLRIQVRFGMRISLGSGMTVGELRPTSMADQSAISKTKSQAFPVLGYDFQEVLATSNLQVTI
jgi:hypothetical protein